VSGAAAGGSAPPAEHVVEVAGLTSRVWEKGEGETLVFLAGLGGLTRWSPCLEALCRARRVVVPALPGYPGGTGHTELDTPLDWLTATLDLIDAIGGRDADWVGVSVGATLAAEAAAASHACRRLVLVAPLGVFDPEDPVTDVWCQRPGTQAGLLCATEAGRACITPDEDDPVEAQVVATRASEAAARLLWPTTDIGLARRLHRIRMPTLLLRGHEDAVLPASYLSRIGDGIGGPTQLGTVAGAGHRADLDAPDEMAARILDFLR